MQDIKSGIIILFLIIFAFFSCHKQAEEESIDFILSPDNSSGIIVLNKDTLNISVSVNSKIPSGGITYLIEVRRENGSLVFNFDTISSLDVLNFKIPCFTLKANYKIIVALSSITNPQNFVSKSIQVSRNRIYINFKRPSYELFSEMKLWQGYPNGYAAVAKLDYNGDGYEDYVWFEGYDVNKEYNWPGPIFDKFDGTTFVRDPIKFPNTKLFAYKLLVGDYNNDSLPDLFLVSHIDTWAGSVDPIPINPPHIIFNSPNGFSSVKSFSDIPGDWMPGCSGDLDKDGDLDVLLFSHHQNVSPTSRALINNGHGEFTYSDYGISNITWADVSELIDMNNDGYLDLVINDVINENGYANRFRILWGNGSAFSEDRSIRLPFSNSIFLISVSAEDLDGDHNREIITMACDASGIWEINLLKTNDFKSYSDITTISITDNKKKQNDGVMNGPVQVMDINRDGKMEIFVADRRLNLIWQRDIDGIYKRKSL